jgi:hypothetical protein
VPFTSYDTVPHQWADMVASCQHAADTQPRLQPLADLCRWLADSPFRAAGLCGVTSMNDLIVGPSHDVLANPYLVISFEVGATFHLRYEDGSPQPWSRRAAPDEIRDVLQRFFVKRARWYR